MNLLNFLVDYAFWSALLMGCATIVMVFINWNLAKIAKEQFTADIRPYIHIHGLHIEHGKGIKIKYSNQSATPTEILGFEVSLIGDSQKVTDSSYKRLKNILIRKEHGSFSHELKLGEVITLMVVIYYRGVYDRVYYKTVKRGYYDIKDVSREDYQLNPYHEDNYSKVCTELPHELKDIYFTAELMVD